VRRESRRRISDVEDEIPNRIKRRTESGPIVHWRVGTPDPFAHHAVICAVVDGGGSTVQVTGTGAR
jgi:hypothetical protein